MDYILNKKKVKRITLKINEEGNLVVTAPSNVKKSYIEDLISENKIKIEEMQKSIQMRNEDRYRYFYLLGEKFTIEHKDISNYEIDYNNKVLFINTKYKSEILPLLYKRFSMDLLPKLTKELAELYGFNITRVSIKEMKTRWGSCNHKKAYINLNVNLIKYDSKAIKYVIIHELCHLIHPNHSKDFYREVGKYCPNYKVDSSVLSKFL